MSGNETNPGVYPGNPSLPREVREKILSTFRHTLNLYKENKLDDCLIGCDFILKMDPRFVPAKKLLEKAKDPDAAVDVVELEALVAGTPTRQERVVAAEPDRLLVRAVESYNARDFDAAAAAAAQVLAVLPGNQDAVEILEKARRKKAAQPQVEAAKQKAIAALQTNRLDEARLELERMKALDPDHPAVALLESKVGPASPPREKPPAMPPLNEAFGGASSEPHIAFDDASFGTPPVAGLSPPPAPAAARRPPPAATAGESLEALSLDSLSLDISPGKPVAPPSYVRPPTSATSGPPPGSPADMWSEPPGVPELELPAAPPPGRQRVPEPAAKPSFDLGNFEIPSAASPEPAAQLRPMAETEASTSEQEISNLLKQGDEAAKRGDRQQAIEVWSRIFLIDINNSDAVLRIEKARQDMAEGNRKIADCLKAGREAFEASDLAAAREMFLQVAAVDENEPTAKFYLDRIEEELTRPAGTPAAAGGAAAASAGPTEAAMGAAAAGPSGQKGLRLPFPPKVLGFAAIFFLLAGAGVWYGVLRQPGPKSAPPSVSTAKTQIDDAATMVRDGKVKEAAAILRRIAPSDPEYPRAKRMLDQLDKQLAETPVATAQTTPIAGASPLGTPAAFAGSSPPDPAQLRAAAEKALADKRFIDALKNFNLALPAYKDDPTFAKSMGSAAEKVTEISPAVKLFNEGEYETAIPVLWRLLHEDRDNQDARSYLQRCYYNQGISQLQNGLFSKALQSFNEVLSIDPHDAEAQRHKKFAERYLKADLDLMGRIYVRHIPHRP